MCSGLPFSTSNLYSCCLPLGVAACVIFVIRVFASHMDTRRCTHTDMFTDTEKGTRWCLHYPQGTRGAKESNLVAFEGCHYMNMSHLLSTVMHRVPKPGLTGGCELHK